MGEPITFTDLSSYTPTSWTWTITPATFNFVGGTNANSQNPQVDFTAAGTYNVQLNATNATGSDLETKNGYITVSSSTANSFNDDFESHGNCGTATNCAAEVCTLNGTLWANLTNGIDDNIDWRVDDGGTPSTGTGPSVDFNPGTAAGNYAYLEASSCSGKTGLLQSSCMTLNQNYDFVFAHHMSGSNMGSLHLDINVGGTWILDIMPEITGDQGGTWRTTTTSLAAYTGRSVKLRIRGITGNGFRSDIAIDDIRLVPAAIFLSTQLEEFTADCQGKGQNLLSWRMSDNNFEGSFGIEKFIDKEWIQIGTVSKNNQINYTFEDFNPLFGENLYRLVMINNDETKPYSNTTVANCSVDVYSFVVFPNPFKAQVSLQFYSDIEAHLPFRITNLLGQELTKGSVLATKGVNTFALPMEDLPQGVYLLHTEGKMIKLVKN